MKPLRPHQKANLKGIVDSFEPILKDDLRRLDYRIRKIYEEARIFGMSAERADSYICDRLQQMLQEVRDEGNGKAHSTTAANDKSHVS